jgi:prepilin-type N-terminal cleavage/methylation domain-containing protein/prepilin-type processing-associated H-X9-DG protein
MNRARGFTLIEMMMVVMIIAILIALLLPAVQTSREGARMTQCRNNLLQLGIALGNYASTHGVLPPGVVEDKGPISNLPVGYHVGWAVQILPFLEEGNLYRRVDFRQGVYAPASATALATQIKNFLCPSDWTAGPMSYMGCHHDVEAPIDADDHGVLFRNSHVAYDDIRDGPAYTILLGEARHSTSAGWAPGTRDTLRNTGHPINAPDPLIAPRPARLWSPLPPAPPDPGGVETLVQGGLLPMSHVGGFSSWHPGGAHFLLCDGSARFVKETIDLLVLRRLGNRADGDLIGDDQF